MELERDFDLSGVSAVDTAQIGLPYPDLEAGRYELIVTNKTLMVVKQTERTFSLTNN